MSKPVFTEDVLNWVWNRCVNDALIKSVAAGTLGYIGSKFFVTKSKSYFGATWPMYVGIGVALGLAWHNCEKEFQNALTVECEVPIHEKKNFDVTDDWTM